MNKTGEFESFNFSIGIVPEDIALFHALYRTSIKGRKDLVSVMFSDDNAIEQIDASYVSRVSEIFNVTLKSLGIGLDFLDEEEFVKVLNDDDIKQHSLAGRTYFCTDYQFFLIERVHDIKTEILEENPVLTETQLQSMIEEELKKRDYINGPLKEEFENDPSLILPEMTKDVIIDEEKDVEN